MDGICTNSACPEAEGCVCPIACGEPCTLAGDCAAGLDCMDDICTNSACPEAEGCVCPIACGEPCTLAGDCAAGLDCMDGICTNSACPEAEGCVCPLPCNPGPAFSELLDYLYDDEELSVPPFIGDDCVESDENVNGVPDDCELAVGTGIDEYAVAEYTLTLDPETLFNFDDGICAEPGFLCPTWPRPEPVTSDQVVVIQMSLSSEAKFGDIEDYIRIYGAYFYDPSLDSYNAPQNTFDPLDGTNLWFEVYQSSHADGPTVYGSGWYEGERSPFESSAFFYVTADGKSVVIVIPRDELPCEDIEFSVAAWTVDDEGNACGSFAPGPGQLDVLPSETITTP
jgi:hypothetical protein